MLGRTIPCSVGSAPLTFDGLDVSVLAGNVYTFAIRPVAGCLVQASTANPYLGGHDDALLGAVVGRNVDDLRTFRSQTGISPAPDPAWLLLRGLKTLEVRVRRQTETATGIAKRLRAHPTVTVVRYPGIGGLLSFDVADGAAARRVETSTQLIVNATSLGGVTSVMETRHRWEGDRVPAGLLRFSAGLEDAFLAMTSGGQAPPPVRTGEAPVLHGK